MNQKIFDAAMEFERIFNKSMSEIQDLKSKTGNISQEKYMEYPLDDRKKMFDILRKFFTEESGDDFVTLFGAYCNHYVKNNYHMILPEKDFGISELWNVITDNEFQKYLLLIQQGIYEQKEKFFEDALKIFRGYSLPHLYSFIFAVQKYDFASSKGKKSSQKQTKFIKTMYFHYNRMNFGLREYVLGKSEFLLLSSNPVLDKNFLPYVKAVDILQNFVFEITHGIVEWYPIYKMYHDRYEFDRVVNTFRMAYEEFKKISNDELGKYPEQKLLFDMFFNKILVNESSLTTEQSNQFLISQKVINDKLETLERFFLYDKDNTLKSGIESVIRSAIPSEWRDDGVPAHRPAYLKIPLIIANAGSFLLDQMEKLKLQKKQDDLISDFTHRYKNLRATRLGEIAESLLKMESEQEQLWGRELLLEQARKETLNKEAAMLNMRYKGDVEKLVNSLKKSLAEDGEGISEVLQTAALNCFIEFFYDETGDDAEIMREQVGHLWKNLDEKRISFERQVIFDKKNCIDWLKENGFLLQIDIDERWREISLSRNDYAEIFLRVIFLEIFKNFLKHGEMEKSIELKLYSYEESLKIFMRNFITETKDLLTKTQYGLKSMDETLKTLYAGQGLTVPENCVCYSQDATFFVTELEMPLEVFWRGEDNK